MIDAKDVYAEDRSICIGPSLEPLVAVLTRDIPYSTEQWKTCKVCQFKDHNWKCCNAYQWVLEDILSLLGLVYAWLGASQHPRRERRRCSRETCLHTIAQFYSLCSTNYKFDSYMNLQEGTTRPTELSTSGVEMPTSHPPVNTCTGSPTSISTDGAITGH